MDGNHIRITISTSDSMVNTYLRIVYNDAKDSIILKDYYYDIDSKSDLLFMDKQKQIINTWIGHTNTLNGSFSIFIFHISSF